MSVDKSLPIEIPFRTQTWRETSVRFNRCLKPKKGLTTERKILRSCSWIHGRWRINSCSWNHGSCPSKHSCEPRRINSELRAGTSRLLRVLATRPQFPELREQLRTSLRTSRAAAISSPKLRRWRRLLSRDQRLGCKGSPCLYQIPTSAERRITTSRTKRSLGRNDISRRWRG